MSQANNNRRGPAAWSEFLKQHFHQSGRSGKLPKKGTDEYNALKLHYVKWQGEGESKQVSTQVEVKQETKAKAPKKKMVPVSKQPVEQQHQPQVQTQAVVEAAPLQTPAPKRKRAPRKPKVAVQEPQLANVQQSEREDNLE